MVRATTQAARDPTGSEPQGFQHQGQAQPWDGPCNPPNTQNLGDRGPTAGLPHPRAGLWPDSPSEIMAAASARCPLPRSPVEVPQLPAATPDL